MVSRGQFEEWLRQDERNAGLFQPEVRETAEPAYTTQTTAVYPGDKNHLPYDVVVQTIRTGEPERLGPGPSMPPAGNFHITDDHLGEGGPKEKYRRNVEAIRTLKAIELEGRGATEAEQEVLSRYGGGVAAGKAPGPALYHSGLDLRISQTKTAPTLKKRRGCSYMCQERRAAFGNHPYHAPAHGQGPERGQRHPRYSGLC